MNSEVLTRKVEKEGNVTRQPEQITTPFAREEDEHLPEVRAQTSDSLQREEEILQRIQEVPILRAGEEVKLTHWFPNHSGTVGRCETPDGSRVYKKPREEGEYQVAEIVNSFVRLGFNKSFKFLRLPKFYEIQRQREYLLMEDMGDNLAVVQEWESNGSAGGADMRLTLSREMAGLIDDFSCLPTDDVIPEQEKFSYNPEKAQALFIQKIEMAHQENYVTADELEKGKRLVSSVGQGPSHVIFNNGDFYPRNLVPRGDKIGVVDWQSWDGDYRANVIDTVENVAAFAFIHMWNNQEWQENFVKELRCRFLIEKSVFQKAVLMKSLDQFVFFGKSDEPAQKELSLFKSFLDEDDVNALWEKTKPDIAEIGQRGWHSFRRWYMKLANTISFHNSVYGDNK